MDILIILTAGLLLRSFGVIAVPIKYFLFLCGSPRRRRGEPHKSVVDWKSLIGGAILSNVVIMLVQLGILKYVKLRSF